MMRRQLPSSTWCDPVSPAGISPRTGSRTGLSPVAAVRSLARTA